MRGNINLGALKDVGGTGKADMRDVSRVTNKLTDFLRLGTSTLRLVLLVGT